MTIAQLEFFTLPHLVCQGKYVKMIISEDPWHSHLLPSVLPVELLLPVFNAFGMSRPGFELQIFCRQGERLNQLPHHRGVFFFSVGGGGSFTVKNSTFSYTNHAKDIIVNYIGKYVANDSKTFSIS